MAPRPRFERLEPEKQALILQAASAEFAQHGYKSASFNRIIDAAGLSKGAMYYYFDDKRDLYLTVVRSYQRDILGHLGEFPPVSSPEEYWQELAALFSRAAHAKLAHPEFLHLGMSMFKSMLAGELQLPPQELFGEVGSWAEGLVVAGQNAGAVRTDLPAGLLVALVFGALEASDMWLIQHISSVEDIDMAGAHNFAVGLFKRLLQPGPDSAGNGWNMLQKNAKRIHP